MSKKDLKEQNETVEAKATETPADTGKEKQEEEVIPTEVGEFTDEQIQYMRITMRKEFNEKFSKWAEIDPEDATDDDIAEAKKTFEDEVEKTKNREYIIAVHEDGLALKTAQFLKEWNKHFNHWERAGWRGVIMFDRVIDKHISELEKDSEKDLSIDYQTLIFLYNSMMNPSGTGLESALRIAKYENYDIEKDSLSEEDAPVTYSGILEKVKMFVDTLAGVDKKLNILKQRVDLAYAGLKMNLKISALEEFIEFNDAITANNLPEDDEKLKDVVREAANEVATDEQKK